MISFIEKHHFDFSNLSCLLRENLEKEALSKAILRRCVGNRNKLIVLVIVNGIGPLTMYSPDVYYYYYYWN